MNVSPKERFLKSLERCCDNQDFIPAFYECFLAKSEDIRKRFRHTDFDKQNKMLLRSLKLAAGATAGEPSALRELHERAETHSRRHLNIEPKLYEHWQVSLLDVASEFDPVWNETIADAWNTVLGHVVKHMAKQY